MNQPPHACSACADTADRASIRSIAGRDAEVEFDCSGQLATVAIDLIDGASVGDTVLIHQGVAIAQPPQAAPHTPEPTTPASGDDA